MPRATAAMKYITRMAYQGQTEGWWVRVQRKLVKGDKPLVISQFFSDDAYGGKAKALRRAKLFRDGAVITAPPPRQQRHQPDGVKNGYGYSRVVTVKQKKRSIDLETNKRTVTVVEHQEVKGWYRDLRGKVHRKKASVERWGLERAQKIVDDWLAGKTGKRPRAKATR